MRCIAGVILFVFNLVQDIPADEESCKIENKVIQWLTFIYFDRGGIQLSLEPSVKVFEQCLSLNYSGRRSSPISSSAKSSSALFLGPTLVLGLSGRGPRGSL